MSVSSILLSSDFKILMTSCYALLLCTYLTLCAGNVYYTVKVKLLKLYLEMRYFNLIAVLTFTPDLKKNMSKKGLTQKSFKTMFPENDV